MIETEEKQKAFKNVDWNRFQLAFPNGSWISTIWGGSGRYCDQYDDRVLRPWSVEAYIKFNETFTESDTVEIMFKAHPIILKKIYKHFKNEEQPYGYVSIEDWAWIVNQLSRNLTWFEKMKLRFTKIV